MSNDFRIRQYIEEALAKTIQVTPEEVKARFDLNPSQYAQPEQIRARHILITVSPDAKPEEVEQARARIQALYVDAKDTGSDFAELAKSNSQCPSAPQGGDLGFFPRGAMVKEFEEAAFALQPGQVSLPIRSQFGFHIIKLEERRAAAEPQLERSRAAIEQQIRLERATEKVRQTISELRTKAQSANSLSLREELFK